MTSSAMRTTVIFSTSVSFDLRRSVVGKNCEGRFDPGHVLSARFDEQVDVLRRTACTVGNDRKAADENVLGAALVQGAADPDEILDLWRARVLAIVLLIQRSASSKLEK